MIGTKKISLSKAELGRMKPIGKSDAIDTGEAGKAFKLTIDN